MKKSLIFSNFCSTVCFFTCLCLSSSGVVFCSNEIEVTQVMTQEEAENIGLEKATPQQRKAFSRWLEKWTKNVIQQSSSYHPSESISDWIDSWPSFLKPNAQNSDPEVEKTRKAANQRIYKNTNGEKIELLDGSIWKIISFDQFTSKVWQRNDAIDVKKSEKDKMRPYILYNTTRNEQAGATLERAASPNFEHPSEPQKYFQGAQIVSGIDTQMGRITLGDGTKWKIAPVDQIKIQTNWKIRDRVRVEKSDDTLYRYKLTNLDSGDSALAIKMK